MTALVIDFPRARTRAPSNRIALTEQRVTNLKPTGSTFYINDARMPGLSVRVPKAGTKSYVYTRKVHGKLVRKTLGKTAALTLEAARTAAATYNGEIAKGVNLAATWKAART